MVSRNETGCWGSCLAHLAERLTLGELSSTGGEEASGRVSTRDVKVWKLKGGERMLNEEKRLNGMVWVLSMLLQAD
jgi:hypothetical protein